MSISIDGQTVLVVEKFASREVEDDLKAKLTRESTFGGGREGNVKAVVVMRYLVKSKRGCRVIVTWESVNPPSYENGLKPEPVDRGYWLWVFNNERYRSSSRGWKTVRRIPDGFIKKVLADI